MLEERKLKVNAPESESSGWTGAKGAREIFLSFFLLWPKIFFVELHVSGNSKTFSPL
jgi:hypothetical protein